MIRPPGMIPGRIASQASGPVAEALGTASWLKVRRALAALTTAPENEQGPEVTLHLLSSFSLAPIESALQLGLRSVPCRPTVHLAPLDTIEQQILDPGSVIYQGRSLATIILWRAEELMPDHFFPLTGAEHAAGHAGKLIARINVLASTFLKRGAGTLYVSTIAPPPVTGGSVLDSQIPDGLIPTIAAVNAGIYQLGLMDRRIRILDLNRWAAAEGAGWHDMQMDFMARQPFTTKAAISFGFFLGRNIRTLVAPRRKVLAVDLDNTLWGGILGEEGVRHLKLGNDFPGSVFLRIQKELLELKKQGVLLVLASKNEEQDALQSMLELPAMLLRKEDFVCRKINFNPKYQNLREAASELGLGLDSFVLLDDSDFEREQMRQFNPEVAVLNERGDALHLLASLLETDLFDTHQISSEDRKRHEEYELRSARTAMPQANIEDFLRSLELRAQVETVASANLERVVQMLGKTNQFNVTTRRHSRETVSRMAALPGSICLTLRLVDKFGDQGIVAVLLTVPEPADGSLTVDSLLVSCRALGRGVEEVLWAELANRAANAGVKRIHAEYLPTAKNGLVAQLFDRFGLACVEETAAGKRYRLEPVKPVDSPPWMVVERISL
jgi:FkbH-like protein